jgi:hypothetical protein
MILEHFTSESFEIENDWDGKIKQPYIFLKENKNDELSSIVAQAISLDIRGNYGDILNVLEEGINEGKIKWSGNHFQIIIDKSKNNVKIIDLVADELKEYNLDFLEWNEALLDWKKYYLQELGFLSFDSKALSHMFGVALLTFDQINEEKIEYEIGREMVTEAVKKCEKRYGVKASVIYRDCKKVTGVYDFSDFSYWVYNLLSFRKSNKVNFEYIMNNLIKHNYYNRNMIDRLFMKHFGIDLNKLELL